MCCFVLRTRKRTSVKFHNPITVDVSHLPLSFPIPTNDRPPDSRSDCTSCTLVFPARLLFLLARDCTAAALPYCPPTNRTLISCTPKATFQCASLLCRFTRLASSATEGRGTDHPQEKWKTKNRRGYLIPRVQPAVQRPQVDNPHSKHVLCRVVDPR